MRKTIIRKVSAEEFERLVKNLPSGKELCFAAFMLPGSDSPYDAEDWWVAQRVSLGREEYTILRHCGGLTSRALVFDSPDELDGDYVKDFLEYSGCIQDGYVNVEFPRPKEQKIEVRTVYGQVKPEIERLVKTHSDNSCIEVDNNWFDAVFLTEGSAFVRCFSSDNTNVPLSELTDDELMDVYDALLKIINGK